MCVIAELMDPKSVTLGKLARTSELLHNNRQRRRLAIKKQGHGRKRSYQFDGRFRYGSWQCRRRVESEQNGAFFLPFINFDVKLQPLRHLQIPAQERA